MQSVLTAGLNAEAVEELRACFGPENRMEAAADMGSALKKAAQQAFDLIFVRVDLLGDRGDSQSYTGGLQAIWRQCPSTEIVVVASREEIRAAVQAVKSGAADYLTWPMDRSEAKLIVEQVLQRTRLKSELDYLRDQFWKVDSLEIVQTGNPAMKGVFEAIRSVASTRSTVLLIGETGTGKGVLARLVHMHSNRSDAQFITVHCGAIPDTLLESELFGHERGAFTGAVRMRRGKFEIAHRGTIFLDEVGTLTPAAQIKLLQVLQDGTFQRVGGEDTIQVDVRVIAATNADLKVMCEEGRFRKDLYYRLNVFPIEIPPLSKRTEDIPHLTDLFLTKIDREGGKGIHSVEARVLEALKRYPWPGNIRELENIIERAYIISTGSTLTAESFPDEIIASRVQDGGLRVDASTPLAGVRRRAVGIVEEAYLKELLTAHEGKLRKAAEVAGITTRQLSKLMVKYGLRKEMFKVLPPKRL